MAVAPPRRELEDRRLIRRIVLDPMVRVAVRTPGSTRRMRVVLHPADEGGCGHYRLIWPGEALRAQGHDVTVATDWSYQAVWLETIQGPRIIGLAEEVDADVVVVQRPLHRNRVELIDVLQAAGVTVVVEIDDDFSAIHPRNPAWKGANPLSDPDAGREWLARACERADLVTCTTPALAQRYGAHGRVVILDNYVPERYCCTEPSTYTEAHLGPRDGRVTVGWTGSVHTHPNDLEQTRGMVAAAVTDTGACLGVVGTGVGVAKALGYGGDVLATGWLPIEAYPEAIRRFDVGIAPLKPSPFNEAKSHLKGLEFAALGVPFVATPTGPYRRLAQLGIGVLADHPQDWRVAVEILIRDEARRADLAAQYRADVAARWTVEGNAWRWLEAWEQAHANSRDRVAA